MNDFTQKASSLSTPFAHRSWRFGQLSAAELLPYLQQQLLATDQQMNWQLVWLHNDGRTVIGLLPKVSWAVYASAADANDTALYYVITTCRNSQSSSRYDISYADWQAELIAYSEHYCQSVDNHTDHQNQHDKPTYQHGLVGFTGYDIASSAISPHVDNKGAVQPAAVLGHYDIYLTATFTENNKSTTWTLHSHAGIPDSDCESMDLSLILNLLLSCLDTLDDELSTIDPNKRSLKPLALTKPLILTPKWQKTDYQHAFAKTQHYLVQGDCYQINLTQAWQGGLIHTQNHDCIPANLIDYLPRLYRNTKAPFAGYLGFTGSSNPNINNFYRESCDFELLSCSPELFFTFIKDHQTGTHHIRTKPIKGTMPRGETVEQDALLRQKLTNSAKDRSENVMIVDLLRNDLGKYAKIGSVKVPQLFSIETFSNVHHMVSTITAELKQDSHPLAVLFGSLPAGSITGTPKKRAVEIIAELEAAPRGAYCGTMGYMNFDGSGQWNVLIRTLQSVRALNGESQVSLWAGGGITVASDCDDEYQECLDKVGNLLEVLAQSEG